MKSGHLWVAFVVLLTPFVLGAETKKPEIIPQDPDAATVKVILEAPGTLSCYKNGGTLPENCTKREVGLRETIHLYQENPDAAIELLRKRLEMDPDPNGVFFAILAVTKTGDEVFVRDLRKLKARMPRSVMAKFAKEAIVVLQTGQCSKKVDPALSEICPTPL